MSIPLKMAWRNIWRNPRRTVLTILAISFACVLLVFMLSWQLGSYASMIDAAVTLQTGDLQVQAKDYKEKNEIRLVVPDPAKAAQALDAIPKVKSYAFRAQAFSLLSSKDRTYGGLVVGIEPDKEPKVSRLKNLIRQGEFLAPGDYGQALVGSLLARNLQIGLGDEIVVLGQGRDGSIAAMVYQVKGIYESGQDEYDRSSIQVTLESFQDIFAMRGAVHQVVVDTFSLEDIEPVKNALADALRKDGGDNGLVVLDWSELMPGLKQSIQMDLYSGIITYVILLIVVIFSILNTFLMAVFERTREFGVMLAIGVRPGRITRLLLLESCVLTLVGVALGVIMGIAVTLYFQSVGIEFAGAEEMFRQFGIPSRMYPQLSLLSASLGPAIVLVLTMLVAFFPALRVHRLKPVQAMAA